MGPATGLLATLTLLIVPLLLMPQVAAPVAVAGLILPLAMIRVTATALRHAQPQGAQARAITRTRGATLVRLAKGNQKDAVAALVSFVVWGMVGLGVTGVALGATAWAWPLALACVSAAGMSLRVGRKLVAEDKAAAFRIDPATRTLTVAERAPAVPAEHITRVWWDADGVVVETLDGPRRVQVEGASDACKQGAVEALRIALEPMGGLRHGAAEARTAALAALDDLDLEGRLD